MSVRHGYCSTKKSSVSVPYVPKHAASAASDGSRQNRSASCLNPFGSSREPWYISSMGNARRDARRQFDIADEIKSGKVVAIQFLLVSCLAHAVVDQNSLEANVLPSLTRGRVNENFEGPIEVVFAQFRRAVRAGECRSSFLGLLVERLVEKHDLADTLGAGKNLAPYV